MPPTLHTLARHPRKHAAHGTCASTSLTQARYPRHPCQHVTHESTPPTPHKLARHPRKHATHASTSSTPFFKFVCWYVFKTRLYWKNRISQSQQELQKKCSFPLRISSINVTKSAGNCGFSQFTEEILNGKLHFLCSEGPHSPNWNIMNNQIHSLD